MNLRRFVTLETVGAAMVTLLVLVAVFAPMLAPHDPTIVVAPTFGDPGAPSRAFPMGTDELGRDVLSRIIFGARISLTVGVAAMAVTMTIGIAIGLCSGFFGGAVDFVLMRFTDLMLSLPPLLLAMALVAVLGPSLRTIFIVIGLVSWTSIARVVRAETLAMSTRDFVVGAEALGAPSRRVIALHILPNVLPIIVVMAALQNLRHAAARRRAQLPRPRRAAANAKLGPHDRRGDDLFPHRALARDLSRSRDLLGGAQFQSSRLRIPAQALAMTRGRLVLW